MNKFMLGLIVTVSLFVLALCLVIGIGLFDKHMCQVRWKHTDRSSYYSGGVCFVSPGKTRYDTLPREWIPEYELDKEYGNVLVE